MSMVRQLPAAHRVVDPRPEAPLLLLVADREPVLEQEDAVLDEQSLEHRALVEEPPVLLRRAEPDHVLDAGAVVPAAVEQDDLAGGGEVLRRSAGNTTRRLALGRVRKGGDAGERGLRYSVIRLIAPPLPAASRPSKTITTRLPRAHPFLELHELCLEPQQLGLVDGARHPRRLSCLRGGGLGLRLRGLATLTPGSRASFVSGPRIPSSRDAARPHGKNRVLAQESIAPTYGLARHPDICKSVSQLSDAISHTTSSPSGSRLRNWRSKLPQRPEGIGRCAPADGAGHLRDHEAGRRRS